MSVAERKAERPFSAPWEAQVFALAVKLSEAGVFTWSEWTKTLGAELSAQPQRPYYESWLAALERIAEGHGTMTGAELLARCEDRPEAWRRCALAFLEAQALRRGLAGLRSEPSPALAAAAPVAVATTPDTAGSPASNRAPRRSATTWLALAASVSLTVRAPNGASTFTVWPVPPVVASVALWAAVAPMFHRPRTA